MAANASADDGRRLSAENRRARVAPIRSSSAPSVVILPGPNAIRSSRVKVNSKFVALTPTVLVAAALKVVVMALSHRIALWGRTHIVSGYSPLARADVRLVFTDVQMPGSMDGLRLAHAVRERWHPIELIVTSARSHIPVDDLPERGRFIPKPYSVTTLSKVFWEMAGAD